MQSSAFALERQCIETTLGLRVVVARTAAQILSLEPDIHRLLKNAANPDDITRTPAYFLSMIREKRARSLVVAVYRGADLIGLLYGFRRCIFGIPVGVTECGDACGDGGFLFAPGSAEEALEFAIDSVMRGFTWLLRMSWIEGTADALGYAIGQGHLDYAINRITVKEWGSLPLDETYELFLTSLGPQTRRNMRYYRRRAEDQRLVFVNEVSRPEASAAIQLLSPFQTIGCTQEAQLRLIQHRLDTIPGSFYSGLKNAGGDWVSILGGWKKGTTAFIAVQLNDSRLAKSSLSTVLRGYVIEEAIEAGIRSVTFLGGCRGILRNYCNMRTSHLFVRPQRNYLSLLGLRAIRLLFPKSIIGKTLGNGPQSGSLKDINHQ
jgi:Acetyltransferase (GNAT) domain